MDIKSIIAKLHPLERKVLPILKTETGLEDICKTAGPDNPRCVISMCSEKEVPFEEIETGRETPEISLKGFLSSGGNVNGTSPARVCNTSNLNCSAIL